MLHQKTTWACQKASFRIIHPISSVLCLFSIVMSTHGFCETFSSFKMFKSTIEEFALQKITQTPEDNIDIRVMQLDADMKLPLCDTKIKFSLTQPIDSRPINTVVLECRSTQRWSLQVPVYIKTMEEMVVASRMINPLELINHSNTTIQLRDKNQAQGGGFKTIEDVDGLIANRLIPAGSILNRTSVKQTPLVKKNQSITLILTHGALEISMSGIAKTDGFLHDTIKILNPSSKKWVDGIVIGNSRAEIVQ